MVFYNRANIRVPFVWIQAKYVTCIVLDLATLFVKRWGEFYPATVHCGAAWYSAYESSANIGFQSSFCSIVLNFEVKYYKS